MVSHKHSKSLKKTRFVKCITTAVQISAQDTFKSQQSTGMILHNAYIYDSDKAAQKYFAALLPFVIPPLPLVWNSACM